MGKNNNNELLFDESVNYNELKQHEYDDAKGYTRPLCRDEYLTTFITEWSFGREVSYDPKF